MGRGMVMYVVVLMVSFAARINLNPGKGWLLAGDAGASSSRNNLDGPSRVDTD